MQYHQQTALNLIRFEVIIEPHPTMLHARVVAFVCLQGSRVFPNTVLQCAGRTMPSRSNCGVLPTYRLHQARGERVMSFCTIYPLLISVSNARDIGRAICQ